MKEKFYNVYCIFLKRWTGYNDGNSAIGKTFKLVGYSTHNPKRMTLDEAKKFYAKIVEYEGSDYVVLEMDVNNKPIFPKCRK